MTERMMDLVNENKNLFFSKHQTVSLLPAHVAEELAPLFANGIKVDFVQAHSHNGKWSVPLFVIEDELTLLSQNQNMAEQIGEIVYDTSANHWRLVLNI